MNEYNWNEQRDARLEARLARLDRRTGNAAPNRASRAQRTKLATAGASATAIVGLMAIYAMSNADANAVDATASPVIDETDTVAAVQAVTQDDLVVVIDAAGNVVSAPESVSDDVVAAAVAARLADGSVSTTVLAPVAEPNEVDLAVPAAESTPTATETPQSDTTQVETSTTVAATVATTQPTTTTTAAAPAQAARPAPQGRSSGS